MSTNKRLTFFGFNERKQQKLNPKLHTKLYKNHYVRSISHIHFKLQT
jgi:hypothetical protein